MAIRWDEFPHDQIRLKIYARLARNGVARAAEDSLRHILRRQLPSLDIEDQWGGISCPLCFESLIFQSSNHAYRPASARYIRAWGVTFSQMRPEIEQAVVLLQRGDDEALEQALALLQNTVFSFSMRVCGQRATALQDLQGRQPSSEWGIYSCRSGRSFFAAVVLTLKTTAIFQADTKCLCHLLQEDTSGLHGQEGTPGHQIRESAIRTFPFTIRFHDMQVRLSALMGIPKERPLLLGVNRTKKANSSP